MVSVWPCLLYKLPLVNPVPIHLIQKWPPLGKKMARVARKQGHKGQFGWNKKKKVNQLTLQHNCHLSSLSTTEFAKQYGNDTWP